MNVFWYFKICKSAKYRESESEKNFNEREYLKKNPQIYENRQRANGEGF